MGTFLVSGKKDRMKIDMIMTMPAKKRKVPYLKEHNIARKDWAMMNVNMRLTHTVMLCPADRVSCGNISLGTSQPRGPQDHPNAAMKRQIRTTTAIDT